VDGETYLVESYMKAVGTSIYLTLAKWISYPDKRAALLKIYSYNSSTTNYELAETIILEPHKTLNVAYNYDDTRINTIITNGGIDPDFDEDVARVENPNQLYERNKVKVSGQIPFYFPLTQTYEVGNENDDVIAFATNTETVSEGQFGQFPLYVFKRGSIHAFDNRGATDTLFNTIVDINDRIGLPHRDSLVQAENELYFQGASTSNEKNVTLYQLQGNKITSIDQVVRELDDFRYAAFSQGRPRVVLGYDFNRKELLVSILSTPIEGGTPSILAYNKLYKVWYYRHFNGRNVTHFFYVNESISTDYSRKKLLYNIYTYSGYESADRIIDLDSYDFDEAVAAKITTDYIKLDSPRAYKKIYDCYIRGVLECKSGDQYVVRIYGGKKDNTDFLLAEYTVLGLNFPSVEDFLLKSKYGSYQYYYIEIEGDFIPDTEIEGFEFSYEERYTHKLRR
jgi:hypothetical protein